MKTLTIIATSHNEVVYNRAFVDSMEMQTDKSKNWKAIVWNNGESEEMWNGVAEYSNRIIYKESEKDSEKWGTENRQQAINECDTDYIIQTSIQDYWLHQAMEYILKGLEKGPDILIWNSINHLISPCQILDAQVAWSKLDWGNFAIRTDIAKKIGIKHGEQYCADYLFIKDCLDSGLVDTKKILKINAILTIHN